MNDYLTSLAVRALAQSPPIVPRLGSLFEAVATRPVAKTADYQQRGESLEQDETHEAEPQPRFHQTKASPAGMQPVEELPSLASGETAIAPKLQLSRPPIFPQPNPEPAESRQAAISPQAVEVAPLRDAPPTTAALSSQPPQPGRREPDRIASREIARPDDFREPRGERNRRDEPAGEYRPVNERSSMSPSASLVAAAQPVVAPAVAIAPALPLEPADVLPLQRHSEPLAIHITIGRVEVRAIASASAPSPASRPASRSARLSLEDYLKERSGGRR